MKNELSEKDSEKLIAVMKRPQDFLIYSTVWLIAYILSFRFKGMQMSGGCSRAKRVSI